MKISKWLVWSAAVSAACFGLLFVHFEFQKADAATARYESSADPEVSSPQSSAPQSAGGIAAMQASSADNIVPNNNLESVASGLPTSWLKGGFGANTRSLSYPVTGPDGSKAVRTEITAYTSGDTKWYFAPVSVKPGTVYTIGDSYRSNRTSLLAVQYELLDGTFRYPTIVSLPSSNGAWTTSSATLTTPANAKTVTIIHLIEGVGYLETDNYSLTEKTSTNGNAMVSFAFDDGWLSQQTGALPALNNAGFKATFYIVTRQLSDYGFSGFMSKAQIQNLNQQGHEVTAHTRTHAHLKTLSAAEQTAEIVGSRDDLTALGISSPTFTYPYGEFNDTTVSIIKNAGFIGARSSFNGYVNSSSDRFILPRQSVEVNTSVNQIKAWVDQAAASGQWLILVMHRVDTSGDQYSVTPQNFEQIVNYVKQKNIRVATVAQGIQTVFGTTPPPPPPPSNSSINVSIPSTSLIVGKPTTVSWTTSNIASSEQMGITLIDQNNNQVKRLVIATPDNPFTWTPSSDLIGKQLRLRVAPYNTAINAVGLSGTFTVSNTGTTPPPPPSGSALDGSCSANVSSANIGQQVTWQGTASGGAGNYHFFWSGDDKLVGITQSVTKSYTTPGTKSTTVQIVSGATNVVRTCSVEIGGTGTGTGDVQIYRTNSSGTALNTSAGLDSGAMTSTSPALFKNVSSGNHTAVVTNLLNQNEAATACQYARGERECTITTTANYDLIPTCSSTTGVCTLPIKVDPNLVTKLVFRYR